MKEEFSANWWKVTLAGEGSVVTGSVKILCETYEAAIETQQSLAEAVGLKSDFFRIELRPVALVQEGENGEPKEIF